MTQWNKIKLSDVADVIGGGTPSTNEPKYWGGNTPWLTPKDLSGYENRYISKGERHITYEGLKNSSAKLMPKGAVLMTSRAPIGYVAITDNEVCTNQGFKSLVLKSNNSPEFFYYLLKANKEYIASMGSGSTFAEISGSQVKELEFTIPEFDEQERIAGILGAFDDKIEVLREQNKTLEDMAKAIFKSWFVDFDIVKAKQEGIDKAEIISKYKITEEIYNLFPNSFTDSPLGPIPTGWEVKKICDICNVSSGKRPIKTEEKETDICKIPVYGGNGIKWYTNETLYSEAIIITGRVGTLGVVYKIETPCWVSDNALVFTPKNNKEFLYNLLNNINFHSYNRGSTQPLITQTDIKLIKLIYNDNIVNQYCKNLNHVYNKIEENNKQIETLTKQRDALLPKLISGTIRV